MKSMHRMRESRILQRDNNASKSIENFRSRFLSILTARREEVEKALDLLVDRQKDYKQSSSNAVFIEDLDQAEREIETNTYYTLLERKARELKKIEFLMNRIIRENEFGLCEECGEKIPEERLLIIPEANLCVPCQRELEKMDSRKKSAERFQNISLGKKKDLQWKSDEDSDNDEELIIETDMEGLSFADLEETASENAPVEKSETKDSLSSLELQYNSPSRP